MTIATVLFSFGGVLGKSANASGLVMTFWRMWIATAIYFVAAVVMRRWPQRHHIRLCAIAGVLFGLNISVFFTSLETLSVATALIIASLAPVVALPLSRRLYGETITPLKVVCAVASVVGAVVAILLSPGRDDGGSQPFVGYFYAVLALAMWVAFLLMAKRIREQVDTQSFMFVVTTFAALACSVSVVLVRADIGELKGTGWLWTAALAIGPGIGGHGLITWAQTRVDASVTSVLIQGEPVGASILAWLILDERISLGQGLAMGGVIVALAVLAFSESRERPDHAEVLEPLV